MPRSNREIDVVLGVALMAAYGLISLPPGVALARLLPHPANTSYLDALCLSIGVFAVFGWPLMGFAYVLMRWAGRTARRVWMPMIPGLLWFPLCVAYLHAAQAGHFGGPLGLVSPAVAAILVTVAVLAALRRWETRQARRLAAEPLSAELIAALGSIVLESTPLSDTPQTGISKNAAAGPKRGLPPARE
jgi:hypothetical protein